MIAAIKSTFALASMVGLSVVLGSSIDENTPVSLGVACAGTATLLSVALWINNRFSGQDKKIDALKTSQEKMHAENRALIKDFIDGMRR